jgi:cholestenol delta-isomerase
MSNTTGPLMITNHPYYPLEVEIASYLANEYSVPFLLGVFFSLCAGIVAFTRGWVRNFYPGLPGREKAAIWWFVICMSQSPVRGEYISIES